LVEKQNGDIPFRQFPRSENKGSVPQMNPVEIAEDQGGFLP
jgi:hypothetical protein